MFINISRTKLRIHPFITFNVHQHLSVNNEKEEVFHDFLLGYCDIKVYVFFCMIIKHISILISFELMLNNSFIIGKK